MSDEMIGKYKLLEVRGEGGFGVLHKALDTMIERIVALKVLHSQYASDERLSAWFRREAKAMARLNHPNIVTIHDFEIEGDRHVIVMEYVDGEDLDELLKKKGALPADTVVDIALQMVSAFGYAHENGIIHRDIKPSNVMLDASGKVKITDFGIAKILGDTKLTKTGSGAGSLHYMSPEQIEGNPIDARTDIYSLGITLYQMLTGKVPFTDESDFVVMRAHLDQEPVRPSEIQPNIPPELERIVMKMLEKKPGDRYDSMKAIEDELERVKEPRARTAKPPLTNVSDEKTKPVVATPDTKPELPEKTTTTNNSRKIPLLIGVLAIIVAVALVYWIFIRDIGEETVVDKGGETALVLHAPVDLQAKAFSTSRIDLSWIDNSDNDDGFRVFRATANDSVGDLVATLDTGVNSYQDTGLTPETKYYYRICPFNSDGDSAEYASITAATLSPPPKPPVYKGRLTIEISPFDFRNRPTVMLGGKKMVVDDIPFKITGIKTGWYRLSVHYKDKSFFEDVNITEKSQKKIYRFDGPKGRVSIGAVFLEQEKQLWAEIMIDGKPIPQTAPCQIELIEGPHKILVKKDGYETIGKAKIVYVKAGENVPASFELKPKL